MKRRIISLLLAVVLLFTLLPTASVTVNAAKSGAGKKVLDGGQRNFKWPVPDNYGLSGCFLDGRGHYAIDIPASKGTKVVASYAGTVHAIYTKCTHNKSKDYSCCNDGFGNYVVLKHSYKLSDGSKVTLYSRYSHLTAVSVAKGDSVKAGDKIGTVGSTGYSQGNHLDFQILKGGWSDRKQYSLDPYVNELLEMPSKLYCASTSSCCGVGPKACCCYEYIQDVKEIYAESAYFNECKQYAAYCTIKANADTSAMSLPCSTATSSESEKLASVSKGTTFVSSRLFLNSAGNYWYKVKLSDGKEAYVPSAKMDYVKFHTDDVKISNPKAPTTLKKGSTFSIEGTIKSTNNAIIEVAAYVYKGTEASGKAVTGGSKEVNTKSYSLKGSDIDNKVKFNDLGTGTYTYAVYATYKNSYAKTEKEKAANSAELCLYTATFKVTSGSTTSCSHSWKDATCTAAKTCSKCGATSGSALGHSWKDATCTAAKTCSKCGATSGSALDHAWKDATCTAPKTCSKCGATSGNALDHYFEKGTCSRCGEADPMADALIIGEYLTINKYGTITKCSPEATGDLVIPDTISGITVECIGDGAFAGCTGLTSVTMPSSVVSIGYDAFSGCSGLTSVNIPNGVKTINNLAFLNCTGLTSVTIPGSVEYIGSEAFSGCTQLTSVIINEGVKAIGGFAFGDCTNLKFVTIPKSVTDISYDIFSACPNLWHILYSGSKADWQAINIESDNSTLRNTTIHYNASGQEITEAPRSLDTCTHKALYQCSICGDVYKEEIAGANHAWVNATCTAPKTCSVCGATEGGANGHQWTGATCTVPKTCSVCGATDGGANGHQWVSATCTAPKTCSVCGATDGGALGHDYQGGKCSRCGESDPNYVPPAEVPDTEPNTPTDTPDQNNPQDNSTEYDSPLDGVLRISGNDRYQTALKAAARMLDHHYYPDFDRRHNYVVVASGTNFADALAGSYLASGLDCPILLVNNKYVDTVKEYIRSNVKPGATVYLLGGQAAVPKNMETGLDGYNVVRLGGANRYETNLKILAEGSKHGGTIHRVFICTGKSFADSLSVSSSGQPILLVKDKLTEDQISYLQSISAEIVIIGGKNAVNNTIEQQLTSIGTVSRIAGSNRYETSYLVAQQVPYDRPYRLCVASGKNFPDGLCGGPLAYDWGGALILTDPGKESYVTKYVADAGVTDGYVLGGKKALPDDTLFTVFECVKYNRAGLIDGEEG